MTSIWIYNTSSWTLPMTRPAEVITNDISWFCTIITGIPHIWLFTSVVDTAQYSKEWKMKIRERRKKKMAVASLRSKTIMFLITWEKSLIPITQVVFLPQMSFNRSEHKFEELQILVNFSYDKILCHLTFP